MTQLFAQYFSLETSSVFSSERINREKIEEFRSEILAAAEKMQFVRTEKRISKNADAEMVLFTDMLYSLDDSYLAKIQEKITQEMKTYDIVISFGVGGSYLGCKVLFEIFCGKMWNQKTKDERNGSPQYYFAGNTLDPAPLSELIEAILRQQEKAKQHGQKMNVLCLGISKSGTTLDTLAPLFYTLERFEKEDISFDVWAITSDKPNPLRRLAEEKKWKTFNIPEGVGGRFSVFSDAGLVGAALLGLDIQAFLAGAKAVEESCQSENWEENPALFVAILKWLSSTQYDKWIEIFMPYRAELKSLAEWYVQLAAESLGKREDLLGNVIEYGRTPVVAVGTTDLHAQNQAHQDGRRDKLVQFITVEKGAEDCFVPESVEQFGAPFSNWKGLSFGHLLDIAHQANKEALTADDRWSLTFTISHLSPYTVGGMMYFFMLAVVYEGFLANLNPFNQPGVEKYKQRMRLEKKCDEKKECALILEK